MQTQRARVALSTNPLTYVCLRCRSNGSILRDPRKGGKGVSPVQCLLDSFLDGCLGQEGRQVNRPRAQAPIGTLWQLPGLPQLQRPGSTLQTSTD